MSDICVRSDALAAALAKISPEDKARLGLTIDHESGPSNHAYPRAVDITEDRPTDAKVISDLRARLLRQADTIEKFQVKGHRAKAKIKKLKARLAAAEAIIMGHGSALDHRAADLRKLHSQRDSLLTAINNLKVENRDLSGALDLARAVSERRMGRTHELEREIARLAEALAQVDGLAATRLETIQELQQTILNLQDGGR